MVEAYLFPIVDENREHFTWGRLEAESIREFTKKTFGWTKLRTDEIILPVIKRLNEKAHQQSIQNYFKITDVTSRKDIKVSKRVRLALDKMSGEQNSAESNNEEIAVADAIAKPKKKVKRKTAKKPTTEASTSQEQEDKIPTEDVKPKPKPQRKRKRATKIANGDDLDDFDIEPSTSTDVTSSASSKKIALPDPNRPIPQREKDREILENNKLKAIEVMKKMKKKK